MDCDYSGFSCVRGVDSPSLRPMSPVPQWFDTPVKPASSTVLEAQKDNGAEDTDLDGDKDCPQKEREVGVPSHSDKADGTLRSVYPINLDIFKCPCCSMDYLSTRGLYMHRPKHESWELLFSCPTCSFLSEKPHAVRCHVPKCVGGRTDEEDGSVKCDECGRRFKTKRGLATHERSQHPIVRNNKRVAAQNAAAQPKQKSIYAQRGNSLWSEEEFALLIELDQKYQGQKRINTLIQPHFPGKTFRQISEKRRRIKRHNLTPEVPTEEPVTTQEPEPSETPSAEAEVIHTDYDTAAFRAFVAEARGNLDSNDLVEDVLTSLMSVIDGNDPGQDKIDLSLNEVVSKVKSPVNATGPNRRNTKSKPPGADSNGVSRESRPDGPMTRGERRAARVASYKRVQELFKKKPRQLAQELLDGSAPVGCEIPPITVEGTYKDRFESVAGEVDISGYPPPASLVDNSNLICPFTGEEVLKAIRGTKPGTAPGPDGVSLAEIANLDKTGYLLAAMFNTWLLLGRLPSGLKANRSILLPKGSDNLNDIGNWRPLTLSSVILRLYSRALAARLADNVSLNPRQKGFIKGSNLAENIELVKALCERSKTQGEPLAVLFLDLAKAFDTVPHDLIQQALRRVGVCSSFLEIVKDMYSESFTSFRVRNGETGKIFMRSGVKQGDPMSPILFNLVLDPLLTKLEQDGEGVAMEGAGSICSLAYADDSCLVSNSHKGMQRNLDIAVKYFNSTGLRLNVKKSIGFMIKPWGKSFTVNNCPQWRVGQDLLPWLKADDRTKYLGARIGPWSNMFPSITKIKSQLQQWCENISQAPLKPRQKLMILTRFAIPRLTFDLTHGGYSRTLIKGLDCTVRFWVKRWLHLPDQVTTHFFYTASKDGGLGIVRLADFIPTARMNNLLCVTRSDDETTRSFGVLLLDGKIDKVSKTCKVPLPKSKKAHTEWRRRQRKKWAAQPAQGKGVECYNNSKYSNNWLSARSFLSEREYLVALKLRTNTFPTKVTMSRGKGPTDVLCRRCKRTSETVGHISGHCYSVKTERLARHDRVCSALQAAAEKAGFRSTVEPVIETPQGRNLKPDLIFQRGDECFLVDPTVVWDGQKRHLAKAWDDKIAKYKLLLPIIAEKYKAKDVTIIPFPVGARGTWYHKCDMLVKTLNLTKKNIKDILNKVLCDTLRMCRAFMDM